MNSHVRLNDKITDFTLHAIPYFLIEYAMKDNSFLQVGDPLPEWELNHKTEGARNLFVTGIRMFPSQLTRSFYCDIG